ncbi:MAG: diaminopimelate epimerase [Gaiellaceae bacterium]|jgi:diaminopimelate epimerase|nr:diaminopimelate epimerase [Gaiellaceae bacterium]
MTSSPWHAHGNVYLVSEDVALTPEHVRREAAGTDGILQVLRAGEREAEIEIWNTDGSTAEMSGNGTRIAGAWLMARTGVDEVRIAVGPRVVTVRALGDAQFESDMGDVEVGPRETVDGIELTTVSVGNPHAVVVGDPDDVTRLGPLLETHPRFPNRTNVQVARVDGPGQVTARVWERGVGETTASGSSAVAVAAATHGDGDVLVHFPGGDLRVRLENGRAWLTGPAEPVTT